MSLTGTNQWRKYKDTLSLIITVYKFYDLFLGIFHHLLSRKIGICRSCTRIEQTQIVVYLGSCTHSGTRILVGRLLLDRDNRTQSCNLVNIRTFHSTKEISGVCGECLYIPALSLGEDCIECKRRLTASTQPGDNRKAVTRYFDIYIFQIMYTCSLHAYRFFSFCHILIFSETLQR